MRIALHGGSFNPPHIGHVGTWSLLLEEGEADELWVVPTRAHPFGKQSVDYEQRVRMCELAAQSVGPRVRVSRAESLLPSPSYTLQLVQHFRDAYPQHHFRWVAGGDIRAEQHAWRRFDLIEQIVEIFIVGRPGYSNARAHYELPEMSSTQLRAQLAAGEAAPAGLPEALRDYIRAEGLYREISSR